MTVAAAQAPPILDERVSARILRGLGKAPVHLFLVLVGLLWLLPTFGLFPLFVSHNLQVLHAQEMIGLSAWAQCLGAAQNGQRGAGIAA